MDEKNKKSEIERTYNLEQKINELNFKLNSAKKAIDKMVDERFKDNACKMLGIVYEIALRESFVKYFGLNLKKDTDYKKVKIYGFDYKKEDEKES